MRRNVTRTLPQNKQPTGTRCITLQIPDDDEWEQQAYSQLTELAIWANWQRDKGKWGKPVADLWRQALDTWRHCQGSGVGDGSGDLEDENVRLRVSPTNPCVIQRLCDCSDEWEDWFDATTCVDDLINSTTPGAVTQPSAGGTLAPHQCKEYTVTLAGGNRWLLPVPVAPDYEITVTDWTGGWNDGTLIGGWYCPDGTPYILGACMGEKGHVIGDPSGTLYHGQLGMVIDGTWYDPLNGPVTVPAGATGSLEFRMNDESLGDNAGSITFHVQVCAGATSGFWSHTFDFTASDGAWTAYVDGGIADAAYVEDTGWGEGGRTYLVNIIRNTTGSRTFTTTKVTFAAPVPVGSDNVYQSNNGWSGSSPQLFPNADRTVWSSTGDWTVVNNFDVGVNLASIGQHVPYITRIEVTGIGTDPF